METSEYHRGELGKARARRYTLCIINSRYFHEKREDETEERKGRQGEGGQNLLWGLQNQRRSSAKAKRARKLLKDAYKAPNAVMNSRAPLGPRSRIRSTLAPRRSVLECRPPFACALWLGTEDTLAIKAVRRIHVESNAKGELRTRLRVLVLESSRRDLRDFRDAAEEQFKFVVSDARHLAHDGRAGRHSRDAAREIGHKNKIRSGHECLEARSGTYSGSRVDLPRAPCV